MMEELSYKLEVFEGPLDLLLHLISKNKLNIYDIPLAEITRQYLEHIDAMNELNMDVASEFIEMAARLVYIKSLSLLPEKEELEKLKEELTGELIEYHVCRQMAAKLAENTAGFDTFIRGAEEVDFPKTYENVHPPEKLVEAYFAAVGRGLRKLPPPVASFVPIMTKKVTSVSSRIVFVLRRLWKGGKARFMSLFETSEDRSEIVATFLAVLELCKAKRVKVNGEGENADITVIKERVSK